LKEYLLRRRDKDFCLIDVSKFSDVLHPNSFESEKISGWGDYRIKIGDCEIAFSFEEAGIQVFFEICGIDDKKAEMIIDEICRNVEKEIKNPCYWIQISD
jgi:hypothetical protein